MPRRPCTPRAAGNGGGAAAVSAEPGESHLTNIRRLTNGGENAEAYFSRDGRWLTFQSTRDGRTCDQQYVMRTDGSQVRRISNGEARRPAGISSTATASCSSRPRTRTAPPALPARIRRRGTSGDSTSSTSTPPIPTAPELRRLTNYDVYTAEGTLSPDGRTIVFTSLKDGDLDIYTMNVDGSNVRRLTTAPGYDGGPFFSPDGKRIVYRAYHPDRFDRAAHVPRPARREMVRPNKMEIWVMNADGSDQRQITNLGGANFAPFFTPDGSRIIFSSNHKNPRSRNFDLYLVNPDGTGLEQITTNPDFDGFPQFSPDGRQLVWASNRFDAKPGETNIFIADWKN